MRILPIVASAALVLGSAYPGFAFAQTTSAPVACSASQQASGEGGGPRQNAGGEGGGPRQNAGGEGGGPRQNAGGEGGGPRQNASGEGGGPRQNASATPCL